MNDYFWRVYMRDEYPTRGEFHRDYSNRIYVDIDADDVFIDQVGSLHLSKNKKLVVLYAPGIYTEVRRVNVEEKEVNNDSI